MVIPSRFQIDTSPVARSEGCCFPAEVSVSGGFPNRVWSVASPASQRPLFPHRVRWWFIPRRSPQVDRVPWRSSLVRVILSLAAALFSSRVEIGVLSGSSVEYLELPRRVP